MLHFFIINKSRLGNHVMVLFELLYCNAPKTPFIALLKDDVDAHMSELNGTAISNSALMSPLCCRDLEKTRAKSLSLHSFFSTLWYYYKSQSSFVASTVAQCELVETRVNMRISKDFQWFSFLFSCVPGKRRRCKNMLATSQLEHWSILWKSGYMMTTLEWHACMHARENFKVKRTHLLTHVAIYTRMNWRIFLILHLISHLSRVIEWKII